MCIFQFWPQKGPAYRPPTFGGPASRPRLARTRGSQKAIVFHVQNLRVFERRGDRSFARGPSFSGLPNFEI